MTRTDALALARQGVREAQKWLDAARQEVTYPGELDEATEAYNDAAEWFFELYDGESNGEH